MDFERWLRWGVDIDKGKKIFLSYHSCENLVSLFTRYFLQACCSWESADAIKHIVFHFSISTSVVFCKKYKAKYWLARGKQQFFLSFHGDWNLISLFIRNFLHACCSWESADAIKHIVFYFPISITVVFCKKYKAKYWLARGKQQFFLSFHGDWNLISLFIRNFLHACCSWESADAIKHIVFHFPISISVFFCKNIKKNEGIYGLATT